MNEIENGLDTVSCKVVPKEEFKNNSYRWKNWDANTVFAPVFDIQLWLDDLDEDISKTMLDLIRDNDDGSYQNHWLDYNIFKWEHPVFNQLKQSISKIYLKYMKSLELEPEQLENLWIRGWAVSLDNGESIPPHCHGIHENSYLSGNISLSDIGTVTNYIIPHLSHFYGPWMGKNQLGRLTLFPSHIVHFVEPVPQKRYSIGFDIYHQTQMDYVCKNFNPNDKDQQSMICSVKLN